ncbi:MAG TPA: sulfur carrier protein ThiS [Bryobacteraceae bacterium]|jgi:sulfur carrier protein
MEATAPNAIQVFVNGESKFAPQGLNVVQLLDFLAIDASRVAVELNRSIVRKQDWIATVVEGGAQVEIVWFVGGG